MSACPLRMVIIGNLKRHFPTFVTSFLLIRDQIKRISNKRIYSRRFTEGKEHVRGPSRPQREGCKQGLLGRETEWLGEFSGLQWCNTDSCNEAEPWSQQLQHILTNIEARGSLLQSQDANECLNTGHPHLIKHSIRGRKTPFHFFSRHSEIMCMQTHLWKKVYSLLLCDINKGKEHTLYGQADWEGFQVCTEFGHGFCIVLFLIILSWNVFIYKIEMS